MKRDDVLRILSEHQHQLRERYGVRSLAVFGSTARGEATDKSDVDLLAEFDRPITLFDLVATQQYLERVLDVEKVDLTLRDSIYPALRNDILGEALYVYGEEEVDIPH